MSPNGESQFLETIKTVRFFEKNPAAVPIDFTKSYIASGHNTGGRTVMMLAAVRNNPTHLNRSTPCIRE